MSPKIVLAINAGSSSVKISVYSIEEQGADPSQLAELQVSGLTAPPAKLTYLRGSESVYKDKEASEDVNSQDDAFNLLLQALIEDNGLSQVSSKSDISVAVHRVVHGGDYDDSEIITKDTYHHIEQLSDLAPLHNGAALAIVSSCMKQLPQAVNLACFDSQFHASIPEHIHAYPINQDIAKKNKLRKYGFHGISYAFIARAAAKHLSKKPQDVNLIALHLGSGASACAIQSGKSLDTSMGLTPVSGLPGATRSGSVDPSLIGTHLLGNGSQRNCYGILGCHKYNSNAFQAVNPVIREPLIAARHAPLTTLAVMASPITLVFHYASDVGKLSPSSTSQLHITMAEEILNKQAGWKAMTGTTDFGAISSSDDPKNKLAFDMLVDRISAYVGSYFVALSGKVDALVFAGGIGEKSARLRTAVVDQAGCLGFSMDGNKNQGKLEGVVEDISSATTGNSHRILVVQTDEQFEMARQASVKDALWK